MAGGREPQQRPEQRDSRLAAARYRVERLDDGLDDGPDPAESGAATASGRVSPEPDPTGDAGRPTLEQRASFVEIQIQQAIRRGEFDELPGAGKPLAGLGQTYDPDWWIRQKIERERLTGLGPPALTLRTEDAQLDERMDAIAHEAAVRELLTDFNRRVVNARRQLQGGPPVVTPTRDPELEVARWRERRTARAQAAREQRERTEAEWAALPWRERRRRRRAERR
ncbi:DUF1992 domain-containing protein [Herbiconiux sp. YIM B11900]|uniref:DnaJ family domain-containing protein n=1 Tax=Herbiconiux sp. YIM B11900 TaxID=3404131 RepID=UPI003F82E6D8